MKYLICIIGIWIGLMGNLSAQCNQTLVNKAATKAGPEAIYIRDFKIKLTEGTMENPSPVGRFPVYLNEGVTYRFTLANDEDLNAFAILQLMRKDKILGSTYDYELNTDHQQFDFLCEEAATYQVLVSFNEGQPGCAAAVLSILLQDSMTMIQPGLPMVSDSAGILYLFTDNEMHIAATDIPKGFLNVSITNGVIIEKNGVHIAHPEKLGEAVIHVEAYNQNGELNEMDSIIYQVQYPPLPQLILPGMQGNVISKSRLPGRNVVKLESYLTDLEEIYKLVEFSITNREEDIFGAVSYGKHFTQKQIKLILSTPVGGKIYLINTRFSDPDGKIHLAPTSYLFIDE